MSGETGGGCGAVPHPLPPLPPTPAPPHLGQRTAGPGLSGSAAPASRTVPSPPPPQKNTTTHVPHMQPLQRLMHHRQPAPLPTPMPSLLPPSWAPTPTTACVCTVRGHMSSHSWVPPFNWTSQKAFSPPMFLLRVPLQASHTCFCLPACLHACRWQQGSPPGLHHQWPGLQMHVAWWACL